ncbi:Ribonuclease HII [hydrothermal vent metagenome]|uniref:Ribonuclease HII n=1 Tax=hydrothermal vent metagenome TaxID=652676 RepID=A0A1W1BGN0_9ZZZZ
MTKDRYPLCGIDEAGRGPLAGDLVIAGVVLLSPIDGLDDSKKLSEKRREELYEKIVASSLYHIVSFDSKTIDNDGISLCLHNGICEIMNNIKDAEYLFDGNSKFGVEGITTMVKADLKVAEVSAASILAKVTRDRMMKRYAEIYPQYSFEKHKGYGTKLHIERVQKYGRSPIHRESFKIKALDEPTLF